MARKLVSRAMLGRRSIVVAGTAVFSALSVMLTVAKLEVPFPFLPYLKFDFAEIPVTIAFLVLGPIPGFLSSIIYWLVLTAMAGYILGPAMKFAAVASMFVGFLAGTLLYRGTVRNRHSHKLLMVSSFLSGIVVRVVIMSIFTIAVLWFIAPSYLEFSAYVLSGVGMLTAPSPPEAVLALTLGFTAIFNAIHVTVSIAPAYMIARASMFRIQSHFFRNPWIMKVMEE